MAQVLLKHNAKLHYIISIIARTYIYMVPQRISHPMTTQGQPLHLPPN